MTITYDQATSAPVVTRAISTIKTPQNRFQSFFGMLSSLDENGNAVPGPAVLQTGGSQTAWDIFDHTREIARGRARGVGPGTIPPQPIGVVTARFLRVHEKMPILDEKVFRRRPIGEPWGNIDVAGQRYIYNQTRIMAQRVRNMREFALSRMLRGGFGVYNDGDDWYPCEYDAGTFNVDFQIPAGNKDQLDMLGDGDIIDASWDAVGTDVIGHVLAINRAFEQLHGFPLRHIWINSIVLGYLLNNTGLKAAAGTANKVWRTWERSRFTGPDGVLDTGHEVEFWGLPDFLFHAYDGGLNVYNPSTGASAYTKFIADTAAIFMPDPSPERIEMMEGSEMVRETRVSTPVERFGIAAWTEPVTQPAGQELIALDNFLPALYLPKAIAYGTVDTTT